MRLSLPVRWIMLLWAASGGCSLLPASPEQSGSQSALDEWDGVGAVTADPPLADHPVVRALEETPETTSIEQDIRGPYQLISWRKSSPKSASVSVPRPSVAPAPLKAEDRDSYQQWMIQQASRIRELLETAKNHGSTAASLRQQWEALFADPRMHEVDWVSFFAPQPTSWDFPAMMALNHTWFMGKEALGQKGAVDVENVLPNGEVPNSAFFVYMDVTSYTPTYLQTQDERIRPQGRIKVTRAKTSGTAEGFFGTDERGVEYIVVFDPPFHPEMVTAAEHIGSTLLRMVGYNVPETAIVRVEGTGHPEYDGRRAVATIALEGFRDGWTYRANRNRREMRGLHVLAAWLHNADQTSQNTGTSVTAGEIPRYYMFDLGASLGSFTFRPKWPRLGEHYLFSPTDSLLGLFTGQEWAEDFALQSPAVGHFPKEVNPEKWRPFYRNFALMSATQADNIWAARILAQITDEQIRTVVALAQYSYPDDEKYVADTLIARRDQLVAHYLGSTAALRARVRPLLQPDTASHDRDNGGIPLHSPNDPVPE